MSKEEKTTELMKKAKDYIPDGGYSEKELNLAFFMFINGYQQAEKDNELTWEDMLRIDEIISEVYKWSDSCNTEYIYQEVLKRFKDYKERKEK